MKQNYLKIVAAILAAAMLMLTGCGSGTQPLKNAADNSLTVLSAGNEGAAVSLLVSLAHIKFPDMHIEFIDQTTYEMEDEADFLSKVAGEIMTGGGPDIISPEVFKNLNSAVENGVFEDLTPFIKNDSNYKKSDYSDSIIAASTFDGKQLFLPAEIKLPLYITTEELERKYKFEGKNLYEVVNIHAANNILGDPYVYPQREFSH